MDRAEKFQIAKNAYEEIQSMIEDIEFSKEYFISVIADFDIIVNGTTFKKDELER